MRTLLTICLALLGLNGASAADIKLLTAGAFKSVAAELVPAFERETGHKVIIENDTAGGLAKRIAGGEAFDVAVLPPAALSPLVTSGKIVDGSTKPLAKVGIGVAVKKGAPLPDIGDVEAFKRALLAARAIAYIDPAAGGTSGIYLAQLFDKMGIGAELKPKSVLVPGGLVADWVVRGEAEIGLQQASEILAVPGATLVGPIPAAVQSYTIYTGGIGAGARDPAAARALLATLSGSAAAAVLKAKGMEMP
jgi:molybdate transport system substrate-binding protein